MQQAILDLAQKCGWLAYHQRPAMMQSGRWVTALTGDKGYPDLTLARNGVALFCEIKGDKGKVSPAQQAWIDALGPDRAAVVRPKDWPELLAILSDGRLSVA